MRLASLQIVLLAATLIAFGYAPPVLASSQALPRTADARYSLGLSRDGWIAGAGAVGGAAALILGSSNKALTRGEVARLSRASVNRFDRGATYHFSGSISDASYVLAGVTMAAPLALLLDARVRADRETIALMYTETMALAVVLPAIGKSATGRIRPFAYDPDAPLDEKLSLDVKGSFFSRHTTIAFASSVFLCTVYDEYHQGSKARPYLWAAAIAAAAGVGYMRYEAGEHFPTDIIAGAVVGSAIGWGIPRLHRVENATVGLAPFIDGSRVGIALRVK